MVSINNLNDTHNNILELKEKFLNELHEELWGGRNDIGAMPCIIFKDGYSKLNILCEELLSIIQLEIIDTNGFVPLELFSERINIDTYNHSYTFIQKDNLYENGLKVYDDD